jgi:hypothetical protein
MKVPLLINAYCTVSDPPPLSFPHLLRAHRDRNDAELEPHLRDFAGYLLARCNGEMTSHLFGVTEHIARVRHQFALEVEDTDRSAFAGWARRANAVLFVPDGSVLDPAGEILVGPDGEGPAEKAVLPFPEDAVERKRRTELKLGELGIRTPQSLPPVVGEPELVTRSPQEAATRALSLFVVALRAESLAARQEIAVSDLRSRLPLAFATLTPNESEFLGSPQPESRAVVQFAWRYECVFVLLWALGIAAELPWPSAVCDVPWTARTMIDADQGSFISDARLRSDADILDALDLHYRLNWTAVQARLDHADTPAGLDGDVVQERHYALNWLTRYQDADWDAVDTST